MEISAKQDVSVSITHEETISITAKTLHKRYGLGKWDRYHNLSVHEGAIGRWEPCYHNSTEFIKQRDYTPEEHDAVLQVLKELTK